jgi:dihydroneopterin aldolase
MMDDPLPLRQVFVRDLELPAAIGVHAHEQGVTQRVRINLELGVFEHHDIADSLNNVVCYETIVNGIKAIVAEGHVNLVETLAERIAQHCLEDSRVETVRVRVEKPDAIAEAAAVGIEIERNRL